MHTYMHHLRDAFREGRVTVMTDLNRTFNVRTILELEHGAVEQLEELINRMPVFTANDDIVSRFRGIDLDKSLEAMIEMGMVALPFHEMMFELAGPGQNRCFGMMIQKGDKIHIQVMHKMVDPKTNKEMIAIDPAIRQFYFKKPFDKLMHINYQVCPLLKQSARTLQWCKNVQDYSTPLAGKMIMIALVLMNTRGVVRERIAPEAKLNKARVKRLRSPVPEFTYIRIGQVYDRSGNALSVSEEHMRRSPIMHLRRAHIRNVRFGKGRTESRPTYIEACIVNYDPSADELAPKKYKVVA